MKIKNVKSVNPFSLSVWQDPNELSQFYLKVFFSFKPELNMKADAFFYWVSVDVSSFLKFALECVTVIDFLKCYLFKINLLLSPIKWRVAWSFSLT